MATSAKRTAVTARIDGRCAAATSAGMARSSCQGVNTSDQYVFKAKTKVSSPTDSPPSPVRTMNWSTSGCSDP